MNTGCATFRRVKKHLTNVGDAPHGNQGPPQDNQSPPQHMQTPQDYQAPVIPVPMTYEEIREDFVTFAQDISAQTQVVDTQAQYIFTQENSEVGPLDDKILEPWLLALGTSRGRTFKCSLGRSGIRILKTFSMRSTKSCIIWG